METRSAKRQKLRDLNNSWFQNNNTGQDRISDLPDAVIHHILILLPLKSVVQTSILSKRWLDLWYTFPDLDFTTIIYNNNNVTSPLSKRDDRLIKNLGNVITNILSLRDKLSDVRLLRFKASMSFSGLHALIRNAVRLRVQELDIKIDTNDIFNFPRSITTHDGLRVLKVKADPGFRLPPSRSMRFGFPTLQILSLSDVCLEKQPTLLDMFTDCVFPQLKKLHLDSFHRLEQLRIEDIEGFDML
uniref:putative F-box/FBD/LRR-repeat protein At4g03220 n=1 Tax=Erigeron canadensis TaxID=72917 RepID=UPI001CB9542B|nr:putative F-box/FBD/LRR-repeat protein At4g03220 [Erigeron canadensis]